MSAIIYAVALAAIDLIGYIIRVRLDESFRINPSRNFPFMWVFHSKY